MAVELVDSKRAREKIVVLEVETVVLWIEVGSLLVMR